MDGKKKASRGRQWVKEEGAVETTAQVMRRDMAGNGKAQRRFAEAVALSPYLRDPGPIFAEPANGSHSVCLVTFCRSRTRRGSIFTCHGDYSNAAPSMGRSWGSTKERWSRVLLVITCAARQERCTA